MVPDVTDIYAHPLYTETPLNATKMKMASRIYWGDT
jgi:hypothetical protein